MNRFTFAAGAFLCIALVNLAGCNMSKVRFEKQFKLEPGGSRTLEIDAPKNDQSVNIEVSAGDTVNVEVMGMDKGKSKPIKVKTDTKSFNEVVQIAAGQQFSITITLRGQKPADVTVKARSVD